MSRTNPIGGLLGGHHRLLHARARIDQQREGQRHRRPGEEGDILRHAVFQHDEVVTVEIADIAVGGIADGDAERHEIDAAAKERGRGLRKKRRSMAGTNDRAHDGDHRERRCQPSRHLVLSCGVPYVVEPVRMGGDAFAPGRQAYRNACALPIGTRPAGDLAAMQLDDLPAHVEANAGASRPLVSVALVVFESEELVEHSRTERGGDAWTRVDDADGHHRRSARVRRGDAMTLDGHAPAFGRVFECIREDIGEDRAQTKRVSRDRREGLGRDEQRE